MCKADKESMKNASRAVHNLPDPATNGPAGPGGGVIDWCFSEKSASPEIMDGDTGSVRGKRKSAISARDAQIAMYLQDRPTLSDKKVSKAFNDSAACASQTGTSAKGSGRISLSSIKEPAKAPVSARESQGIKTTKALESEKRASQGKAQPKKIKGNTQDDSTDQGRVKRRSAVAAEDAQFARHLQDREWTARKPVKMSEEEDAAHHHLSRNQAGCPFFFHSLVRCSI
jgi:hypothetical protein